MIIAAIPFYESDTGKRDILNKCLKSLKGQDATLVLEGKQDSLPKAWNMLLEASFGVGADYTILANDDIRLIEGDLKDLCIPDKVVSPLVNGGAPKIFHCHIAAIPREIYEKVGGFDERFLIYWSDTDYAMRLKDAKVDTIINDKVNVLHPEPARTLKSYPNEIEHQDKEAFIAKWGRTYIDPIKEYEGNL